MNNNSLEIKGKNNLNAPVTIDSMNMGVYMKKVEDGNDKEVANVVTQEWYGVNGEDAYIPNQLVFRAYDMNITFCAKDSSSKKAEEIKDAYVNAVNALKERISMENTYNRIKHGSFYIKNVQNEDVGENFIIFKVTFRITEP